MALLAERVAIVTGASRGIGRGIALGLAREGAAVVINYNSSASAAEELVAEIERAGGKALALQADVAQLDQAEGLIKAAVESFGKLDILVNNAGITRDNVIMMMQESDWDDVIDTNLKSCWNCCKHAARAMMRKRYGRIINISSISGIVGQGGQSNYSASKAGMIGLSKSLAKELAGRNITVNTIAPGFINTDMTNVLEASLLEQVDARIPLGRRGEAEDVAAAVIFLASEQAGYITGQVLAVDGGLAIN